MQINQKKVNYIVNGFKVIRPLLVKSIETRGKENLNELVNKQFIALPNHLSYFDWILLLNLFKEYKIKNIATVAGNNLDRRPTNLFLNEDTGFYFVDRMLLEKGTREEKAVELLKKRKSIEEIVNKNYNFLVFVEGGFRQFNGEVMKDISIGYPRDYIIEVEKQKKNLDDYLGVNIAIKYEPYPIEYPFIEKSRRFKEKMKNAETEREENKYMRKYYLTDIKGYVKQIIKHKKPVAKINIGKPYLLKEFLGFKKQVEFEKFIKEDIKRLYNEL